MNLNVFLQGEPEAESLEQEPEKSGEREVVQISDALRAIRIRTSSKKGSLARNASQPIIHPSFNTSTY